MESAILASVSSQEFIGDNQWRCHTGAAFPQTPLGELTAFPQTPLGLGELTAFPQTPLRLGELTAFPQTPLGLGELTAFPQTPLGELTAFPQPSSCIKGGLLVRRGRGRSRRK